MTRRVELPSEDDVHRTLAKLRSDSSRPVTAHALATRLGMTNSTFWRWFPQIAQSVADERRQTLRTYKSQPTPPPRGTGDEAKLRSEIGTLRDQLQLAVATIQRLSLELHDLRASTAREHGIIPLRPDTFDT